MILFFALIGYFFACYMIGQVLRLLYELWKNGRL